MDESISGKIVRNTAFNALGYFWGALIAVAMTPYVVSRLGDQAYGILVIAGILTGYFGLLDFGINTSFIKYISEFNAKGDRSGVGRVVFNGLLFYAVFSAAVALPGLYFARELVSAMKIPAAMTGDAVFLVRTGFLIFVVSNISSPFTALQRGLQRMDISNLISMTAALFNAAGVVAAIESGYGVKGVMLVYALVACTRAAADLYFAFRIFPGLDFKTDCADWPLFRRMFSFGYKLQVARISGMISAHFDKLLIMYFLSAGLVTAYQIGNMIAVYAVTAYVLLTGALMPAFSEIDSLGDREKAVYGYEAGSRYISLAASPVFIFLILFAPGLIYVWMGDGYGNAALALRVLAAGWLVNTVLGAVGGAFVQALGRPQVQMRGALVNIILNPVLSLLLLLKFGFAGAMAGTATAICISAFYFTWDLHREFRLPLLRFLASVLLFPFAASAAAGTAAWLAFIGFEGFHGLPPKISAAALLCMKFFVFSAVYTLIMVYKKPVATQDADRLFGSYKGRLRGFALNFCREAGPA